MNGGEQRKSTGKKAKGRNSKEAGDEYEGELNKAGKREGKGTCRFAFGDVYEGSWKAGKMDGRGTYRMADGDVYEGSWKAGAKEGPGTYWYASGRADVVKYAAGSDAGEGARWAVDRQMAWRLHAGEVVDEISLEEAAAIAERLGEPVPPQVSAVSPLMRATGAHEPPAIPDAVDVTSPAMASQEVAA